jgi:hypothetical protein
MSKMKELSKHEVKHPENSNCQPELTWKSLWERQRTKPSRQGVGGRGNQRELPGRRNARSESPEDLIYMISPDQEDKIQATTWEPENVLFYGLHGSA